MRRTLQIIFSLLPAYSHALPVFRPDVATSESEPRIQNAVLTPADVDGKDLLQKIADERRDSATKPKTDITGINLRMDGLESTGGPDGVRLSDAYDLVVVINKARDVQRLSVHRFYNDKETGKRVALKPEEYPISTGQERWTSCAPNKKGDAMETRWMGTPTGYFNPYYIHADHHSGQYDDANMFKGTFFNSVGIATHEGNITTARASHGCVRMNALGSAKVMMYTLQTGVTPNVDGGMFKGECPSAADLQGEELAKCQALAEKRSQVWKMLAKSSVKEGEKLGLFYSAPQQIPDLNQEGKINRGEDKQPKMKANAYKALFVVQCIDGAGRDCSTTAQTAAFKAKPDCSQAQPTAGPEQQIAKTQPTRPTRQAPASDDPVGDFFSNIFGGGGAAPKAAPRQRTTGL